MFRQFLKLTLVEFRIFLREPVAVFFNLFFPLMFLFLTMEVFLPADMKEAGAINIYLPSFIVIITIGVSFFNIPIYIVKYRNSKFLKRLRVAPLSPVTILLSLGFANLLMLFLGLLVLVLTGLFIYGAQMEGSPILLILGLLIAFVSIGSLGLLIASFCRGLRTVNVIGQMLYYPLLFLSGAIPISLGKVLNVISQAMPTTYAVDLIRRVWDPQFYDKYPIPYVPSTGIIMDLAILGGFFIIGMTVALKTFKWE